MKTIVILIAAIVLDVQAAFGQKSNITQYLSSLPRDLNFT